MKRPFGWFRRERRHENRLAPIRDVNRLVRPEKFPKIPAKIKFPRGYCKSKFFPQYQKVRKVQ